LALVDTVLNEGKSEFLGLVEALLNAGKSLESARGLEGTIDTVGLTVGELL
jgi:hypothetical protein